MVFREMVNFARGKKKMTEKFTGIVLDIRRHSDRHNIVTLYTRERGRLGFLAPAGAGKSARVRQSRLQPLAVIEGDFRFKPVSELQTLGAFSMHTVWTSIYFHPVKQMQVLFLSEFLNRLLRAAMPDSALWDYILNALSLLDRQDPVSADFHIAFLTSLLPFAGIQPDPESWEEGLFFDMQSGTFTDRRPLHRDFLFGEEARMASVLARTDFSNVRALSLNRHQRNRILDLVLRYYGLHFPGTANLKSPAVLRDLFEG